ncbi:D-glycero-beta-D-manno-heptose 1,7-bisphosphate 7-phosphatase [Amphritea japonica]|uniref:D,D-heptose 1,7-bisphosphate phosphatase n=1 Tax=Amphritea japonica ATCC BAA-1530 TaxID=1278309 RepID=A0A7R6P8Q1_9GAMM|nr:D-glycero-beta-D-manno-heptose 1,7-bisphosphate 7-phosphatase [Amphritea japonica]BBB24621.1 D-glycero-D-manno-heptose 1,7-bisphosphate phosphatase [Amphritea japonica ATCC BAA-1530]
MKLVILDRDGVINHDSDNYIRTVDEWQPLPGSIEAIARLSKAGFDICVATNQSGLARGYFNLTTLNQMHHKMEQLVVEQGGRIDKIEYCPHSPDDNCFCRKPLPGMYQHILSCYPDIDPGQVYVVGDSLRDLEAAEAAGCPSILVKTGKGNRTLLKGNTPKNTTVVDDLEAAALHIIYHQRRSD